MERKRAVLALLCCIALVTAGCAGGGDSGAAPEEGRSAGASDDVAASGDAAATDTDGGADDATAAPNADGRAVIRTGDATVQVDDFREAREAAVNAARERGGFVGASDRRVHTAGNRSWSTGSLTLRVPSENFSAFLREVRSLGQVETISTDRRDVTGRLVDLNARIENLEGQREQLRELYNRSDDTEELLRIQERLSEVQTEIEQLEGQRQSLRERVAYSTLTLRLEERPPEGSEGAQWYDTPLTRAFVDSVSGVGTTLRMLAVGLAYAAPYLLVFGTPIAGVVWWRRPRGNGEPDAPGGPETGGDEPAPDEDGANSDGDESELGSDEPAPDEN